MTLHHTLSFSLALAIIGGAGLTGVWKRGALAQGGTETERLDKPAIRRPIESSPATSTEPRVLIPEPRAKSTEERAAIPSSPSPQKADLPRPAQQEKDQSTAEAEAKAEAKAEMAAAQAERMSQLAPIGRVFRGVKIPNYSGDTLGSVVHADFMRRADDEHLEMEMLEIVNYNQGEPDSRIITDRAIYDIEAKTLRSTTPAKIIQKEFEMRGDRMIFDSETGIGHMTGRVKTIIHQVDQFGNSGD